MAPLLGFIITGTFVIEIIFSIPGIGRYFVTAISSRDYSVVMGITVLVRVIISPTWSSTSSTDPRPADKGRRERDADPVRPMPPAALSRTSFRALPLRRRCTAPAGQPLARRVAPLSPEQGGGHRRRDLRRVRLFCVIWPIVSPYDIRNDPLNFSEAYETPSLEHPLGTDKLGKDMLTKLALGGRISIAIGVGATLMILLIGVVYGSIAGFAGGVLDNIQMRLLDALYGLPYLPFAIIVLAIIGENNIWTMVIALSIASWFTAARIVRGQIITLKENDHVRRRRPSVRAGTGF